MSNRLGWTALSRDNVSVAYPEEIMCNKRTGEFLVNIGTTTPKLMSYQNLTRFRDHVDKVEKFARDHGIVERSGYTVKMENMCYLGPNGSRIVLPDTIALNTNCLGDPYSSCRVSNTCNQMRMVVSVDMDQIIFDDGEIATNMVDDAYVTVEITFPNDDSITPISKTMPVIESGKTIIHIPYDYDTYMNISNITFSRSTVDSLSIRYILHSIIILTENEITN